jgi:hypothetical protein
MKVYWHIFVRELGNTKCVDARTYLEVNKESDPLYDIVKSPKTPPEQIKIHVVLAPRATCEHEAGPLGTSSVLNESYLCCQRARQGTIP